METSLWLDLALANTAVLLTSSEVELMETECPMGLPGPAALLTSSEVELMETLRKAEC